MPRNTKAYPEWLYSFGHFLLADKNLKPSEASLIIKMVVRVDVSSNTVRNWYDRGKNNKDFIGRGDFFWLKPLAQDLYLNGYQRMQIQGIINLVTGHDISKETLRHWLYKGDIRGEKDN